ncbi:MAG: 4Fe-4S dicluster domain-containing protein, partial [Erysipelotrichaceae bacterium]|nr:4Fe-4S dicluster domain-containing protein [Erysipelotrichaceae bacterium]
MTRKISLRSERVQANKCNGCRMCEKISPAEAVQIIKSSSKAIIEPALCHQCQNCETVCPKDAIHYTRIV